MEIDHTMLIYVAAALAAANVYDFMVLSSLGLSIERAVL